MSAHLQNLSPEQQSGSDCDRRRTAIGLASLLAAKRPSTFRQRFALTAQGIVRPGVNIWGWTWRNRRVEPPGPMPRLRLTTPSGAVWQYGEGAGLITGSATEFCRVVTQCRNIADTSLEVTGDVAHRWMAVAQCFAGPPQDPPAPGTRFRKLGV